MLRNRRQGFTTLATLAGILLLASLTMAFQTRAQADLRILARLTKDLETQAAKDSLYDRLRPLIAEAMTGTPGTVLNLDSTVLILMEDGRSWEIRVQDVEGQVDLYLASPKLLAFLGISSEILASRAREIAALPSGARFPVLPMTVARFGLDSDLVEGLITQNSNTGMLRIRTRPPGLRKTNVIPGPREWDQVTRVAITIQSFNTLGAQP